MNMVSICMARGDYNVGKEKINYRVYRMLEKELREAANGIGEVDPVLVEATLVRNAFDGGDDFNGKNPPKVVFNFKNRELSSKNQRKLFKVTKIIKLTKNWILVEYDGLKLQNHSYETSGFLLLPRKPQNAQKTQNNTLSTHSSSQNLKPILLSKIKHYPFIDQKFDYRTYRFDIVNHFRFCLVAEDRQSRKGSSIYLLQGKTEGPVMVRKFDLVTSINRLWMYFGDCQTFKGFIRPWVGSASDLFISFHPAHHSGKASHMRLIKLSNKKILMRMTTDLPTSLFYRNLAISCSQCKRVGSRGEWSLFLARKSLGTGDQYQSYVNFFKRESFKIYQKLKLRDQIELFYEDYFFHPSCFEFPDTKNQLSSEWKNRDLKKFFSFADFEGRVVDLVIYEQWDPNYLMLKIFRKYQIFQEGGIRVEKKDQAVVSLVTEGKQMEGAVFKFNLEFLRCQKLVCLEYFDGRSFYYDHEWEFRVTSVALIREGVWDQGLNWTEIVVD